MAVTTSDTCFHPGPICYDFMLSLKFLKVIFLPCQCLKIGKTYEDNSYQFLINGQRCLQHLMRNVKFNFLKAI